MLKLRYIDASYEMLAFKRTAAHRFERPLPADGGELVIELRVPDGRSMSQQALVAGRVAHRRLHCHTPGCWWTRSVRMSARPRLLSADDVARRNLRAGGAVFVIDNDYLQDGAHSPWWCRASRW